jgi:diketogulonate reductase-like aldo/keto reductase
MQSRELIKFCRSKGIVVEGYSLLRVFFGLNNSFKYSGKFTNKENEFINSLAAKYNKTPIQIIIR